MPQARMPGNRTGVSQKNTKTTHTSSDQDRTKTRADLVNRLIAEGLVAAIAPEKTIKVTQHATPRQHVIVWLVGAVLASLLPFLFLYVHGLDKNRPPGIYELLGRGDLLLISLVVTIGGITEVVLVLNKIDQRQMLPVALYLLGGVLAVVAEAAWYADITARLLDGQPATVPEPVTAGSLILFGLSALCSSACVRVAAGAR